MSVSSQINEQSRVRGGGEVRPRVQETRKCMLIFLGLLVIESGLLEETSQSWGSLPGTVLQERPLLPVGREGPAWCCTQVI